MPTENTDTKDTQNTAYKSHSRNGGWNTGKYVQTDVPFTVAHDRDIA